MIKNIVAVFFVFFYIYAIPFVYLPVSTRVLYGIFGFVVFIFNIHQLFKTLKLKKEVFVFLVLLFSLGFISMVSLAINSTFDIEFIKYVASMLAICFASYFVVKVLIKLNYKLDFKSVSLLITNVVLLQSVVAFAMFIIPELRDFLLGIQALADGNIQKMSTFFEFRIIGFGAYFFWGGYISGLGLILIGTLLRVYKFKRYEIVLLSLKFLIIFIIGLMIARTTLIGGVLALLIIFMPHDIKATIKRIKTKIYFVLSIVIFPLFIFIFLYFVFPSFADMLKPALEYSFEMFINYFEKGKIETASTNHLQEMYIFPDNLLTWIIGDGLWTGSDGYGYYMHTDVGYLRLIYYFGLIGMFIYLTMQIFLIIKAYKSFDISANIYSFVVIYFLILNFKGFTDLLLIFILFFMAYLLDKKYFISRGVNY